MELNRTIIDSSFFPAPFNIQSELAVLNNNLALQYSFS